MAIVSDVDSDDKGSEEDGQHPVVDTAELSDWAKLKRAFKRSLVVTMLLWALLTVSSLYTLHSLPAGITYVLTPSGILGDAIHFAIGVLLTAPAGVFIFLLPLYLGRRIIGRLLTGIFLLLYVGVFLAQQSTTIIAAVETDASFILIHRKPFSSLEFSKERIPPFAVDRDKYCRSLDFTVIDGVTEISPGRNTKKDSLVILRRAIPPIKGDLIPPQISLPPAR